MRYPRLQETRTSKDITDSFYGYNHNLKIGRGEFFDEENMTAADFPIMSPRKPRGIYKDGGDFGGLIAKDALCYVDGSRFYINQYPVEMGLTSGRKQLVSMGAYVLIFPDKKYINTKDLTDYGSIEAVFTSSGEVSVEVSLENGNDIIIQYRQVSAPENPINMEYWLDTNSNTLKQWSEASEMWVDVPATYLKISASGIGTQFSCGDGVMISGLSDIGIDGSHIIWSRGDNWIVITGIISDPFRGQAEVSVSRRLPLMDFVIESGNRLWGCRYGMNISGDVVNEIYASKLGDFKNWGCFAGISTDSYMVSRGSDGQFTGAISYGGHPIFFKENVMHKIYGNMPGNFQVQDIPCNGVQKGSDRSLAIVNEVLYYKSRNGVCAYDGSIPIEISEALGYEQYFNAVSGGHRNIYYISMVDDLGIDHLFTYDTKKRIWHREDMTKSEAFCSCDNNLYFITHGKIMQIFGNSENVGWMAETGIIGTETPSGRGIKRIINRKYINRILVRMALPIGSVVRFQIQYDSIGDWETVLEMESRSMQSFTMPIRPRRCDHFRLRISGFGDCKIYSITNEIAEGSELG